MNLNYSTTLSPSQTRLLSLCFFVSTLSSCTVSSFDDDGRLITTNFGIKPYNFELNTPQFIDLRNDSVAGLYTKDSITIGYKSSEVNRVQVDCRALIITNQKTKHVEVVQFINELVKNSDCEDASFDYEPSNQLDNADYTSILLGYSKVYLSQTFPPDKDATAYSFDFWGVEVGNFWGVGHRAFSVISSGNNCSYLLVAESKNDFEFYKTHLDFNQGKELCIALKP